MRNAFKAIIDTTLMIVKNVESDHLGQALSWKQPSPYWNELIQDIDSLLAFSINPEHVFPIKKRAHAKARRLKTSLIVTIYECLCL